MSLSRRQRRVLEDVDRYGPPLLIDHSQAECLESERRRAVAVRPIEERRLDEISERTCLSAQAVGNVLGDLLIYGYLDWHSYRLTDKAKEALR